MTDFKTKKPKYKDLALYLSVTEQAVKQYTKIKRDLMIQGLWLQKERGPIVNASEDKTTLF